MINLATSLSQTTHATNYVSKFVKKSVSNAQQYDVFDKKLEYINDVIIHKKIGFFKSFKQVAKIFRQKLSNDGVEKYFLTVDQKIMLGDIDIKIDNDSIFISNLESYARKKYKGIGSKLLQVAVERGMVHGPSKNVVLNAQRLHFFQKDPVTFYEKMGFQIVGDQSASDITTYGTKMVLSPSQHPKWMEKIKNSPILLHN